ncbi:hypothetical protein [Microbacterium sp. cx-55]|uniref:hypothetical protein n=1 Tax=Microbacterium sp. cx-55 TaxID=2875948 RepID=UPI001CBDAE1F|nr:hypothetical protein [Microbacterium sp. cx-55]MBZ4486270.1 hypothetical protein [Microbacterium sp. cx-55]
MDTITAALLFWIALSALGVLIGCLLAFFVIRTAILGALKAHSRWERSGAA